MNDVDDVSVCTSALDKLCRMCGNENEGMRIM